MKIYYLAILLITLSLSVRGQFSSGTLSSGVLGPGLPPAPPVNPTNITGYPALTWYVMSSLATNGSVVSVTDRVRGWNLTNGQSQVTWPLRSVAALNGLDAISFIVASNSYLANAAYTSGQPHEVTMVMAITNTGGAPFVFDGGLSAFRHASLFSGTSLELFAGSGLPVAVIGTFNKWMVWNFVFNGASSTIYTNNVAGTTVDVAGTPVSGFAMANRFNLANPASMVIVEMATYGTNLSISARSNLNYYFTNKYAISQP